MIRTSQPNGQASSLRKWAPLRPLPAFSSSQFPLTSPGSLPTLISPRVAKALVTLVGILFAASLCLVPGQWQHLLGLELMVLGTFVWIVITVLQRAHTRGNPYVSRRQKWLYGTLTQLSALPLIVCGASLFFLRGGGLYWLVVAVIMLFASALLDAWVLLIEIQR